MPAAVLGLMRAALLKLLSCPCHCFLGPAWLQRVTEGRRYFDFEFTAKSRGYTRHALASVTVGNGGWGQLRAVGLGVAELAR